MGNSDDNEKVVHQPLEHGLKTIEDIFTANEKILKELNPISTVSITYKREEYSLPSHNKFLHVAWNKIYLITIQAKKLKIELMANFVPIEVKECTHIFNDKSGKKPLKYYLATLKNASGKIEKDVEISNNSKSDNKQFQTALNESYNDFSIYANEAVFKAFISEFISPKVASTVTLYTNAGRTPDGNILYENALVRPNEIIWADKDGYIKTGENTYVKIVESTNYLPKLTKSEKTGTEIAKDLMLNIKESWSNNVVLPLMVLGNMVMAIFYDDFIKRFGAPTLILYGSSGSGKSTLVVVGLAIFGLTKEALTSGGSTAKSNEFFCSKYNCLNVCIDDVKAETLKSSNFITLVKGMYKGIPRTKMLPYGRGVEYIHTCSPLAYSTNETLPDLRELINRLNVVEIFGNNFDADKFKYHEFDNSNQNNLKELSLILPEFLKYTKESILAMYERNFEVLKNNVKDTQKRVISNIAYAYTGAQMLSYISDVEFENLEEKVITYAQEQVEKYENIETPVDKLIQEFIVLYNSNEALKDIDFKVVGPTDNGEYHLRFHKATLIAKINNYFRFDKSKQIDEKSFTSYLEHDERNRTPKGGVTVRLGEEKSQKNSVSIDITDIEELTGVSCNFSLSTMPAEDLTKGNNM